MNPFRSSPWLKLAAWAGLALAVWLAGVIAVDILFAGADYGYEGAVATLNSQLPDLTLCAVGTLLALTAILWSCGYAPGGEGPAPTWQERVPLELSLLLTVACCGLSWLGIAYLAEACFDYFGQEPITEQAESTLIRWAFPLLCAIFVLSLALLLRTVVVRLKTHTFPKSALTYYIVVGVWKALKGLVGLLGTFFLTIPLTWRVVAGFFGYCIFTLYAWTYRYPDWLRPLWFFLTVAVLALLCWWTVSFHKLREGAAAIAAGDLNHQIDTSRMPPDLKQHGETLNHLSDGLHNAVTEQMKSERMKAQLITNVSHDLKTPLTSIINYVDLLKKEDIQEEKAREYIEVLDRKSQRLKRLTEDLVEASKASTGALTVHWERLGVGELVGQALAEYSEKLAGRSLTPVLTLPPQEVYITADGRHLWRVLDNLLGNCVKYAMEGTRVYLDVARQGDRVTVAVKNISANQLNLPAEQLMERFVRGDESRTTEGSGLGLSIARSLTELQGGEFQLEVDGDLFKAVVSFPAAE